MSHAVSSLYSLNEAFQCRIFYARIWLAAHQNIFLFGRCLLGPEIREGWSGEYAEYYRDLDHSFIPITFFYPNMPNPYRSKCLRARQKFEGIFQEVMDKRVENGDTHDDFLQVGSSPSRWRGQLGLLPFQTALMLELYCARSALSLV